MSVNRDVSVVAGLHLSSLPAASLLRFGKPLCVDLDGTLIATDVLWESLLLLIKWHPRLLLSLPFWLLRGKAHLKEQLARRVVPMAAALPYRSDVVEYIRRARVDGRMVVLATASDDRIARDIVQHMDCFDDVIASDGRVNLSGHEKRDALVDRFGRGGFDYIGNSAADLATWESAQHALIVGPSRALLRAAQARGHVTHVFETRHRRLAVLARALRMHQWLKNLLVFVPLIMAHRVLDLPRVLDAIIAFVVFSLLASSIYIANDLLDLESDRQHPRKKNRPFAAGHLSIPVGIAIGTALFVTAIATAIATLPGHALIAVVAYGVLATLYSFVLKQLLVLDVVALASLYVLRIFAGALAVDVPLSHWLLGLSMFLFLSLALMKRHTELTLIQRSGRTEASGRAYQIADREWIGASGTCAGYMCVVVLALYITSHDVEVLYRHPAVLWPACVAVLFWITRLWALAFRGEIEDDPVLATLKDRVTYVVGVVLAALMMGATMM